MSSGTVTVTRLVFTFYERLCRLLQITVFCCKQRVCLQCDLTSFAVIRVFKRDVGKCGQDV